jgi:cell division protein FtsA
MSSTSSINVIDPPSLPAVQEDGKKASRKAPSRRQRALLRKKTVAALDLGTTKICAMIGKMDEDGQVRLLGMGQTGSRGLKKGMVADIDKTVDAICEAVGLAEKASGHRVDDVYVGIAGGHISCVNGTAMIEVANPYRGVTEKERRRVLERAKAIQIPEDREILHVVPQEFICDDQEGVQKPVGISCQRLQARVHLVTAAVASAKNVVRCVHRAGLQTADLLLESLASSMSILTEDEKDLGVLLIDIGGGTSDVALFRNGAVRFSGVVPYAGNSITHDVSEAFCIRRDDAEVLKCSSGIMADPRELRGETVSVPTVLSGRPVQQPREFLSEVIEARVAEILESAYEKVERAGMANAFPSGVVLTGGGSQLEEITELAEEIFDCDVRVGAPEELSGDNTFYSANPALATAQGLLLYGLNRELNGDAAHSSSSFFGKIYQKFIRRIDLYS